MVKEVETKSILQQISDGFKYAWTQTKLGFREFGILVGIIPKVSQKTHPNVFHPEKEQRDVHNPMLKELKNNPPKLKSVTGSSIKDLERSREKALQKLKEELYASPEREVRVNPPKLKSESGFSIDDLEKRRAEKFEAFKIDAADKGELRLLMHKAKGVAEVAAKKAKNAEHRAAVKARKADLEQKAHAKLEADKQLHEQRRKQADAFRIAQYSKKTVANITRRALAKARKAELDREAQLKREVDKQLHEQKQKQIKENRDALIAKRIQEAVKHNDRVEDISKKKAEWKANVAKHDPMGFEAVNAKRFMQLELSLEALHKEIAGR
ncbi:hypothetical protein [Endozoicomonas atrinae]|uniref:hypothetical protein n=1 Tax=Endozoicomonas atrinae TaxID=1333660 RepID=UPI003B005BC0